MITRLMVANRAEIASRVFRTCRSLGIECVAVHSDADADLPYVRDADLAVRLAGSAPGDTYLRADLLVEAAQRAGADAVHPGYGFLSESADFARAVTAAGLTWVGPPADVIEAMGSKVRAKELMRAVGVPVLEVPEEPGEADLPLLVKASAGGGGRGMRVVRALADLPGELEAARAEAASAFGDGTVFCEPYVERGRHVEVQVLADDRGTVSVLGTRDCSVQRRHQKVIEEAPAFGLPAEVEQAMCAAACRAAEAIGYRSAGTVEFLYDPGAGRFFFLEMNTRLQVEHPVTEAVTGLDLVRLQIAVAEGHEVAPDVRAAGHAIEARLYAEDPVADYQPHSGRLATFEVPGGPGVRVDRGFVSGSEVSTFYDAMLAKVVVHAATRGEAARTLAGVLRRTRVHGVATNRDQLVDVLTSEAFLAEEVTTRFLDDRPAPARPDDAGAATAAALALAEAANRSRPVQRGVPAAWRNVVSQPQRTRFEGHEGEVLVEWWGGRDGYRVAGLEVVSVEPDHVVLEVAGVRRRYRVASYTGESRGDTGRREVWVDGPDGHVRLRTVPRFTDPDASPAGSLLAPMPGTVVSVAVAAGEEVAAGQPVLVLEAMKMRHTVRAPHTGLVARLDVEPGAQVSAGQVVAVVDTAG